MVMWYQVFLPNTNNFQTDLFDSCMEFQVITLKDQSGTGSNGCKEVTPHSPDFQNLSFTYRYRLVLYPEHLFGGGECNFLQKDSPVISDTWFLDRKRNVFTMLCLGVFTLQA